MLASHVEIPCHIVLLLLLQVFEPHPEAPGSSTTETRCVEPPRCMIWSEREACERQVTQIGTSACGATAVVNVFVSVFYIYTNLEID